MNSENYTKEQFQEFETFIHEFGRLFCVRPTQEDASTKKVPSYINISKSLSRNPVVKRFCGFDEANSLHGEFMGVSIYVEKDINPIYIENNS